MPRTASVTTTDGDNTFQLQDKKFVGKTHSATRAEFRRVLTKLDKLIASTKPLTDSDGEYTLQLKTAYTEDGTVLTLSYAVSFDSLSDVVYIGCMGFDKKAITKIKKWATAATATKQALAKAA